jgi:hypothetical protein
MSRMTFSLTQPGHARHVEALHYTSIREARPNNPLALPAALHSATPLTE